MPDAVADALETERIGLGKSAGQRSDWKKAYVTLKEGDRIEFFEGA